MTNKGIIHEAINKHKDLSEWEGHDFIITTKQQLFKIVSELTKEVKIGIIKKGLSSELKKCNIKDYL